MTSALFLAAAGFFGAASEMPDFEWKGALSPGRVVEVRGVTGDIRAVPSDRDTVEVTARVERDGTAAPVEVQVRQTETGISVCAVRSGAGCPAEGDPGGAPGARVDYVVKVPAGVHFAGRTVNGIIAADSLQSNVTASTVNGNVTISTTGSARAHTVNGSIDAELLRPFWSTPPELTTVNGGITLKIPRNVNAPVKAETRNGKVVATAPFRGTATEQSLEGNLGRGGGDPMLLRSINGSIEIQENF